MVWARRRRSLIVIVMSSTFDATGGGERVLRAAGFAWLSPGLFLLLSIACLVGWIAWPEDGALFGLIGLVLAVLALAAFWRIKEESVIVGDGWIEIRSPFTGTSRVRFDEVTEVRGIGDDASWRWFAGWCGSALAVGLFVFALTGWRAVGVTGAFLSLGTGLSGLRTRYSDMWLVLPRARSITLRGWIKGAREIGREIERRVESKAASAEESVAESR
jgi:hypothetical protein